MRNTCLSLLLFLTLSGCWLSSADLLAGQTLSDSGFEGSYVYNFNELNPARRATILRTGRGTLTMIEHDAINYPARTSTLRTLDLGQGYFLVARTVSLSPFRMGYSLVRRREDGAVIQYRTACDDWVLTQAGVERDSRNRRICAFRSFGALEAVALSAIRRGSLEAQTVFQPVEPIR